MHSRVDVMFKILHTTCVYDITSTCECVTTCRLVSMQKLACVYMLYFALVYMRLLVARIQGRCDTQYIIANMLYLTHECYIFHIHYSFHYSASCNHVAHSLVLAIPHLRVVLNKILSQLSLMQLHL